MEKKGVIESAAKFASSLLNKGTPLLEAKRKASAKFGLRGVLKNSEILRAVSGKERAKLLPMLKLRPTRTASGVTPVAVMANSDCPHGKCLYCPRGANAAQSYTGKEPAAMRAIQNNYDPKAQVLSRLGQYKALGHPTSKCELIIMGGTFLAQKPEFQEKFVKQCFDAFNGKPSKNLESAKKLNERAAHRVVGVTFETRPDWAREEHASEMLRMGGTRVELGVQTIDDEVYKKVERGHTVRDVVNATRICRDAGLKVCYHIMPGLFATPEKDIAMFTELFSNPDFRPDMLKIYPCMVLEGTGLYKLWKKGKYAPYDTEQAAEVIEQMLLRVPRYVRVMRVQRDIPSNLIAAGVKNSNLMQIIEERLAKQGLRCGCIRCREAGIMQLMKAREAGQEEKKRRGNETWEGKSAKSKHEEASAQENAGISKRNVRMLRYDYFASGGTEVFLSFEDVENNILLGFLRLRIPARSWRREIGGRGAIVRELHVYGGEVSVGEKGEAGAVQHSGYGEKLLAEAERIARKSGKSELIVISGVGSREYYYRHGYEPKGPYVAKQL